MNNTYVVQAGDTLYGIARQHNTSVQRIKELNKLTNENIYPSQVLIISENDDNDPTECVTYTVKKGDNLYNIARKYNTTVDEIKRYNNLNNNNLSIGQKIRIPCNVNNDNTNLPKYTSYTVKKGDSLYSIAKEFDTTVDKLKKDNNLTNENLSIGQTLLIEDSSSNNVVEECIGVDFEVPTNGYVVYTVKKGDNLYNIARKYNTTVDAIKNANNLKNNNLSIGQELNIPVANDNSVTKYTVQKGESLYSIAKKFNTTVDEIKRKNNLQSNLISVGQELII